MPNYQTRSNSINFKRKPNNSININLLVILRRRSGKVGEGINQEGMYVYNLTQDNRVGQRIRQSFRTTIFKTISGQRRREIIRRKRWILLRRKPRVRTLQASNMQQKAQIFSICQRLLNGSWDTIRISYGGLSRSVQ